MSDMRKEVDYRLAQILCADMCAKGLIQSEKEKDAVNHSMLEQFAPPFASLEQEIPIQLSKDDFNHKPPLKGVVCTKPIRLDCWASA